jgi:hypothetical protein
MRLGHRAIVVSVIGTVVLGVGALGAAASPPSSASASPPVSSVKSHGQAAAGGSSKLASSAAPATSSTSSTSSASACGASTAFSQFGDDRSYALLANGTLETGGPARRSGKPAIVPGNESFYLHASSDTRSLQLRPGDSVAFHATCLPRLNPVFRFVAHAAAGSGTLKLQVQYGPAKRLHAASLGTLASAGYATWTATPALPFLDGTQRLADQVKGNVWLVLTAAGSATWQVDDLYIDPYVNK